MHATGARDARCGATALIHVSNAAAGTVRVRRRTTLRRPGPRVTKRPEDDDDDHGDSHYSQDMSYSSPRTLIARRTSLNTASIPPDKLVWDDFRRVRTTLNTRFYGLVARSVQIEDVAHSCVDLFTRFLFPNTPIAHEPTLRGSIPLLSGDDRQRSTASTDTAPTAVIRRFTLITALCAHIMSIVPESLSKQPQAKALSIVFFDASRSMLRAYEGYDLEHPDATSLTVRMWHSSCAQNTTGKVGASWHYHTEACCLAQWLRLYDEKTVSRFPPL